MEGEMRMQIGEYGNRRRDTLPYPVYVTNNKRIDEPRFRPLHKHAHAREKSLNFFAFKQQQMGNWPINCCDDLGLPIKLPQVSEPVGESSA